MESACDAHIKFNNKPPFNLNVSKPKIINHNSMFDAKWEEGIYNDAYVDVFGRPVAVLKNDNEELYVSVNELKKLGITLFKEGSLPTKQAFNEQSMKYFEYYIKLKALKFISDYNITISEDRIKNNVERLKNEHFTNLNKERVVTESQGMIKITTKGQVPSRNETPNITQEDRISNNTSIVNNENEIANNSPRTPNLRQPHYPLVLNKTPATTQPIEPRYDAVTVNKSPVVNLHNITHTSKSSTPATLPKTAMPKLKRKLIIEKQCNLGIFGFVEAIDKTKFIAFVLPSNAHDDLLALDNINDCPPDPSFKPNIGELVAASNDEEFCRAVVIKHIDGKYQCAFIDYGIIKIINEVRPLPSKFKEIPEFSCECTGEPDVIESIQADGSDISLEIKEPFVLSLTLKSGTTHVIRGKAWDVFGTTEVVPIPTCVKEKQIIFKKLPASKMLSNNSVVIIIGEESGFLLVRSKECVSSLKEVNQELVNYKGIPFESPPEVGWLVVSPFNDGNWYRAVVVSISNGNAVVEYTDYGNSETIPLKDLKNTTDKLATINNTLFKISLKQFVGATFNSKSLQFLAECSAKKEKFKTEIFSGIDVFDLISANGSSLSNKLMELNKSITASPKLHENGAIMKTTQYSTRDTAQSKNTQPIANKIKSPESPPITQKSEPSKTLISSEQHEIKVPKKEPLSGPIEKPSYQEPFIKLENFPASKLTKGAHTVICLYAGNIVDCNISFCNTDSQTSELLTEITSKIWDFVQTNNNPYSPQILEICLAKYEDEWYRAAAIDVTNDQFILFFIDYGNIARTTTSNIRKLPKELEKIPSLAILCTLDGLPATIEEPLLSRMKADITEENIYDVVVLEADQNWYIITIPSLMEAWKKDGLL